MKPDPRVKSRSQPSDSADKPCPFQETCRLHPDGCTECDTETHTAALRNPPLTEEHVQYQKTFPAGRGQRVELKIQTVRKPRKKQYKPFFLYRNRPITWLINNNPHEGQNYMYSTSPFERLHKDQIEDMLCASLVAWLISQKRATQPHHTTTYNLYLPKTMGKVAQLRPSLYTQPRIRFPIFIIEKVNNQLEEYTKWLNRKLKKKHSK